jgi:hypothetical protein
MSARALLRRMNSNPPAPTAMTPAAIPSRKKRRRFMAKSSQPDKLYQLRPKKRVRPLGYPEDGWYTLDGYIYEADKLSRYVAWARRHHFKDEFTVFASINITEDLTGDQMKGLWSKVCRYLKNNHIVALYVCEISRRSNRFNYHLLLRSQTPNLKVLLKFAMKGVKTNIMVEPYDTGEGRFTVRYMTKAKTAKYKNGELHSSCSARR